MNKPLAREYSGKQKCYSYEMFSSLKYDQSDSIHEKESEEGDKRHSGGDNLVFKRKTQKRSSVKIKQRGINCRIIE